MNNHDWTFSLSSEVTTDPNDPLRWRKQALYVGAKPVLDDGSVLEITDSHIDTLLSVAKERLDMGIKHPLVINDDNDHYTRNPNDTKGNIDTFEEGYDLNGRRSLYLAGDANSQETMNVLRSNDISIFAPVGDKVAGREWGLAVKNALVTSYPKVKGLEEFQLALSEPGTCAKCSSISMRLAEMEKKMEDMEDEPQKKGKMKDGKDQITAGDHIRRLHKGGTSYRSILEAIVRADPEGLVESLEALEPPRNRFHNEDHDAIDSAAHALAETNQESGKPPKAWLVREDDATLVLAEFHPEAFQVVEAR